MKIKLLILASFILVSTAYSETTISESNNNNILLRKTKMPIKVFIISGQSNAAGYNHIKQYKKGKETFPPKYQNQPNVLFWFGEKWSSLKVHKNGSFGPEISFAYEMAKAFPKHQIAIVKYAIGGTGIARSQDYNDFIPQLKNLNDKNRNWYPGSKNKPEGLLFKKLRKTMSKSLSELQAKGQKYELSGFVWMQGEHEAGISKKMAEDYGTLLKMFITAIRQELKMANLNCLVGGVNSHTWRFAKIARAEQRKLCSADRNMSFIDTTDISRKGSGGLAHFDTDGMLLLGTRFASAMKELDLLSLSTKTKTIFNGRDLKGWHSSQPELWRVDNGEIVGSFTGTRKASNFLFSDMTCENFRLNFKVKVVNNRGNSGVQFWSQPHRGGAKGFQADIGPGYWACLYEEYGRGLVRKPLKGKANINVNDWNDYQILAIDGHIILTINGQVHNDFKDDGTGLTPGRKQIKGKTKGHFALQLHPGLNGGKGTEIRFKDFALLINPEKSLIKKAEKKVLLAPKKIKFKKRFREGAGNNPSAKAKTVKEQLALFSLPDGFIIENVSHEKLGTIKPISLNFDDAGRLWTQTASAYPIDRNPKAFERKGNDKILFFPSPHLQQAQTPKVFAAGLVMPISVLPHNDGVHVINGSKILKLKDTNGDGKADQKIVLMSGFGVKDSHTCLHRLTWGPGNWIYFSQGVHSTGTVTTADNKKILLNQGLMARYQPDGTKLQVIGEGMNNVWAWSINSEGRTYIHEANDLGYSQVAFERDATYPSFLNTASRNPLRHPPTSPDLGLDGTGFCGIASAGSSERDFPKQWRDFNFIANPITGEINTVSYKVDKLGNHHFNRETDLLTCADPMFRPVNVRFGPDGCLYIIDWYNRVISHGTTTRNLKKHARTLGRIWRIRHKSQKPFTPPNIEKAADSDLVAHLSSKNIWEMRAAINQIGKRQKKELIPAITRLIRSDAGNDSVRIHALWALEALSHFDVTLWEELFKAKNANLRYEALRSLSSLQPPMKKIYPLFEKLKAEESFYVLNELVRFFRDTPQKLNEKHLRFIRTFHTIYKKLPNKKINGWKGQYYALGGSYEKRFLNQLIEHIKGKSLVVPADEKKWGRVLEDYPKKSLNVVAKLNSQISRLAKMMGTDPKGNLKKGKAHYATRCATCHDFKKKGFAPPLGGGSHRSPTDIITAILKPNDAIESLFLNYKIIKKDGSTIEGFRSSLSHKEITLTFIGGAEVTVPLTEISKAGYIKGKSVMPEGMTSGLSDQDMIDLISYIRTLK